MINRKSRVMGLKPTVRVRPRWKKKMWKRGSVGRLLPNAVTLLALCMGLSAIRFAFLDQNQQAVGSVLIAGLLDGLDGRLARFLKTSSDFGAELDSLADFINFGVAPSLILYCTNLQVWNGGGWLPCLFFSCAMALRLARFNIQRLTATHGNSFSVGVPAPAGALLAMSPLVMEFVFNKRLPVALCILIMVSTAVMLVSRYPTFVFKKINLPERHALVMVFFVIFLIAALVSFPWETLLGLTVAYLLSLPVSGYLFYRKGWL